MFGSYAHAEVLDGEWARDHYPDDGNGNAYSKRRPTCSPLEYLGNNPQSYINCAYDKESNASENDWTDLMSLTFAMDADTTPANDYVQAVRRNLNVEIALRHFAVLFLMNYTETALANGEDDDYDIGADQAGNLPAAGERFAGFGVGDRARRGDHRRHARSAARGHGARRPSGRGAGCGGACRGWA